MSQIRSLGGDGQVSGIAADLSTAEGVAHLVGEQPEIDILVNNLGIFEPKPFGLRVQSASVGYQRSRPAGRWRSRPGNRLS